MNKVNIFNLIPNISGMDIGTAAAGIKYQDQLDLLLITFNKTTKTAGVFTQSSIVSETINWSKKVIKKGKARALIVNSGNANCFTGEDGKLAIYKITAELAIKLGCKPDEIVVASTGVIGQKLPYNNILKKIDSCLESKSTLEDAAKAIMTTDTKAKFFTKYTHISGIPITLNAIAKGSGMAAPNMATILSYIFTDAKIPADILQNIYSKLIKKTLNCMTIDSDTSTNDMSLIFATGEATNHKAVSSTTDSHIKDFINALNELLIEITQSLVRDAEGATKFITVNVKGAKSYNAAHKVAKSIAESPLVKTAIFGSDPNWGRIIMAIGKSQEDVKQNRMSLKIGDTFIVQNGEMLESYNEAETTAPYMQQNDINIEIDLGFPHKKSNHATIWTSDFSKEYVAINADYRS